MRNFYIENSSGRYAVNGDGDGLGAGAVQRGELRLELLRRHRLRPHSGCSSATPSTPGTTRSSPPARRRRRSTPTWRSSTCGIATTTTATATSTSRTATSTTSSRSTPARARKRAAARRAPTRSGATAGTLLQQHGLDGRPGFQRSAASGSATANYWIGDYTVEPENGGVGVFAHEFGHDLGLPDLYDTSGNTGGAENSTGFWTPCRSGSYGSDGSRRTASATRPISMSAWEKLQLGWLELRAGPRAERREIKLGTGGGATRSRRRQRRRPARQEGRRHRRRRSPAQVLLLGLGQRPRHIDDGSVTLPAGATLSAKVRYNIETDWDYAYLEVSTTAAPLEGPDEPLDEHEPERPELRQRHHRRVERHWVDLTANWGVRRQTVRIGFRYWTDGAVRATARPASRSTRSRSPARRRRRRRDRRRLDVRPGDGGFHVTTGTETSVLQHLPRREPAVHRLRQLRSASTDPGDRAVQLRRHDRAELGRALPVPGRHARLVLGHVSTANNNVGDHPGEG